jgi:hypothetical protein
MEKREVIKYKKQKLKRKRVKVVGGGRIRKERRDENKFEEKIAERG